jgi:hypothetical protein
MPLPLSGAISIGVINTELGRESTATSSLDETALRSLANKPSGTISLSDFYGKALASFVTASGGSITTDGDFRIHTFTSTGTFTVTNPGNSVGSNTIEVLIVAGGGGGGSLNLNYSGGGGAGGVLYYGSQTSSSNNGTPKTPNGSSINVSSSSYSIVIGAGGGNAANGGNTTAFGYTAIGGGAGASSYYTQGNSGGSGGGGGPTFGPGGAATSGQGYIGGNSSSANAGGADSASGAGGGAQGPGNFVGDYPFTNSGVPGGPGVAYAISGSVKYYAAGGSNAGRYYASSADGIGGASNGAIPVPPFSNCTYPNNPNAVVNTGSGGAGGSSGQVCYSAPGSGSSGIVIIRYKYQ